MYGLRLVMVRGMSFLVVWCFLRYVLNSYFSNICKFFLDILFKFFIF